MRKPPKSVEKLSPEGDAAEEGAPEIPEPLKFTTNWLAALGEDV